MSSEKKEEPPPICISTSRRILQRTAIQDLPPGRIICLPGSLTSSPSESRSSLNLKVDCNPGLCCARNCHHDTVSNGSHQEQQQPVTNCAPDCRGMGGVMIDDMPCCREMLRRLAEEALSCHPGYAQLDKRVSIQESQDQKSDLVPDCCVARKPVATAPECSMHKEPKSTPSNSMPIQRSVPKKDPCCNIQDCLDSGIPVKPESSDANEIMSTYQVKPKVKRQDDCSEESCTAEVSLKNKNSTWTNTEWGNSLPEPRKGSDLAGGTQTPRLRPMPPPNTPVISRNTSGGIAAKFKLFGKLDKNTVKNIERVTPKSLSIKSDDCYCDKNDNNDEKNKEKSKKKKSSSASLTNSCGRRECSVNTCTCRFPPAYGGYFDCTGQISGNCCCDKNN